MTERKMKIRLAGNTYLREVPDETVKRDATFYGMYRTPMDGLIGPDRVVTIRPLGPDSPGWSADSTYRQVQDTPDIGPWRYEIFKADAAAIQAAGSLTDHAIDDDRADWFTDIFLWTPFSFVRASVKDFLDARDPGGHLFFPTRLFGTESGDEITGGPYYQWMPARRLYLSPTFQVPHGPRVAKHVLKGRFGSERYAWHLLKNRQFRDLQRRYHVSDSTLKHRLHSTLRCFAP